MPKPQTPKLRPMKACDRCGGEFEAYRPTARFCSSICRNTFHNTRSATQSETPTAPISLPPFPCVVCGGPFRKTRSWQSFCSAHCRKEDHRKRMRVVCSS